jgi:hypothetical protein
VIREDLIGRTEDFGIEGTTVRTYKYAKLDDAHVCAGMRRERAGIPARSRRDSLC